MPTVVALEEIRWMYNMLVVLCAASKTSGVLNSEWNKITSTFAIPETLCPQYKTVDDLHTKLQVIFDLHRMDQRKSTREMRIMEPTSDRLESSHTFQPGTHGLYTWIKMIYINLPSLKYTKKCISITDKKYYLRSLFFWSITKVNQFKMRRRFNKSN